MHTRRQLLMAAVVSGALLPAGLALAIDDCGGKGCPPTQQNNPQGQQQPNTLQTIQVTAQKIKPPPPATSLSVISYGGTASGGRVLFRSNNYVTTTKQNKNRSNHDCKDTAGDPIELSTGTKIESLVLFQLPGEMGLRYELDYTSTGGWHDNLDYELDPTCGGNDHCFTTSLRRPDGSTVKFFGSYAGTYQGRAEVGGGGLATLDHNADDTYVVHDEDGTVQTYDGAARLIAIKDEAGVGWTLSYSPGRIRVTDAGGRYFTVGWQYESATGKYNVAVTDPAGHAYQFVSSSASGFYGQINSLTLPGSPATVIGYKYSGYSLIEVDYNGVPYGYTTYANGRATGTHLADGSGVTTIAYTFPASGRMTAVITNPLGHKTTNQYTQFVDPNGAGQQYMLTSSSEAAVSDCGATVRTIAYDSNGNPTSTIDNNGITHTYSYAVNGQLQTETEASGTTIARKTDYAWDANQQLNRLNSVTVAGESKISYAYNAQNRLASVKLTNLTSVGTLNQSLTTTYAYTLYANGTVKTMTMTAPSPSGTDKVTYQYDTHGNVTSATDGLGHATTYTSYNGLGEPGHSTGPNGDVTDFTYDARGRVTRKTMHPNGVAAAWTYTYDGYGLLTKITAPDGEITTWTRNAVMRVTSITHNDKDGTSTEAFGYDANGDVTSDVVKRGTDIGSSRTFVYDGLGRIYQIKGAHGQKLTYAYDGNGNVVSVTDALLHVTTYAYDGLNRVSGVMNAAGGVTSYTYDKGDHVTRVTDPRNLVTTYSYDGLGQLWKQVSPDTGTTTLVHDSSGRLSSKTRNSGIKTTYSYDALNRLTGETAGGITRTFAYDTCTHGIGRLCTAVHVSDDTVSYSYTPEGRIATRHFSFVSGASYGLAYSYDNMGHLASVTYPDGNQALYDYTRGVVADVRLKIGSASSYAATSMVYRPMDLALSGWTSSNGLPNRIDYDSDLRPTRIAAVVDLAFSYDLANHITGITNRWVPSLTQSIGYDAMGRITTIASDVDNESYTYDADGNRTHKVLFGNPVAITIAPDSNRLLVSGGSHFAYDADGNVVSVNGNTLYHYDPFGRVDGTNGTWVYSVGADGQRLREGGPATTYFAPDRSGVLLAEDLSGTWQDYVYLNGRLLSVVKAGQVYAAHDDQTGRTLGLTDSSRVFVWKAQGMPFWTLATINNFGTFNLGYPGQYEAHGRTHNGYREYFLGRYAQSDPIGLAGGINTYAYVGNNPVSNIDPLGLCDEHKCNKLERGLAIGAIDASKFADASGNYAKYLGGAAAGGAVVGAVTADPVMLGAAGGAAGAAGGVGMVSEATSVASGLLNTVASGGNFRYLGRAVLTSLVGGMTGELVGAIPVIGPGLSTSASSYLESHIGSLQPLPPPCDVQ